MQKNGELREFLRASRARLRPEDVGLVERTAQSGQPRRVAGLRREEVAQLAQVSVDYYARLEQGRTGQVSASVLTAIADALRLNLTEREYLSALVSLQTTSPRASAGSSSERVRPSVHRMLSAFGTSPAVVMGLGMTLLAMNSLARTVFFDFTEVPLRERNLARWTFLSKAARTVYVDWEKNAAEAAAVLRADAGEHPDDPVLNELIGELTVKSAEFRRLWAAHKVHRCGFGNIRLRHPITGEIVLDYEALDIPGASEQKVVVYLPGLGSPSEEALTMLASWNAPPQPIGASGSSATDDRRGSDATESTGATRRPRPGSLSS